MFVTGARICALLTIFAAADAQSKQPMSLLNLVHKFFGTTSPTAATVHADKTARVEELPDLETYLGQVNTGSIRRTTPMPITTTVNGTKQAACGDHHFMCDVHREEYETKGHLVCLPNKWRCDNVADCPDQSDEFNCQSSAVGCTSNHIVCNNAKCVQASLRCNGFDDCGDGTDELDCADTVGLETTTLEVACDINTHYKCNMGQCISSDAYCDGFQDCPGGDDESSCANDPSKQCLSHQFKCHSTPTCIEQSWVCDGMHDCTDHSDEMHCNNGELVPSLSDYDVVDTCTVEEFKCLSGSTTCIDRSSVCDGTSDCGDASDEGAFCGDCREHGCEQECSDSPMGPSCYCSSGHVLAADGMACKDVNECSTGVHGCAHECVNTHGSYHCVCAEGYSLSGDDKACVLQDTNTGGILVLMTHSMQMMPLFAGSTNGYETLPLHTHGFVTSMSVRREMVSTQQHNHFVHVMNNRLSHPAALSHESLDGEPDRSIVLFSTRSSGGASGRVYVLSNRQAICALDNVVGVTSVVVDANTGNVYYAQASPANHPAIGVCDTTLRYCRTLLAADNLHRVRTLAVHNALGRIYYAHTSGRKARISSLAMDGTDVRTVAEEKMAMPTALTMHEPSNMLYWVDADLLLIERVHVISGRREVMYSHGIHDVAAMAVFNGRIVWIDRDTSSLVSASLDNPNDRKMLQVFSSPPQAMAVQHSAYTPITQPDSDPCSRVRCAHLCLTRAVNTSNVHGEWSMKLQGVCHCPNAYSWDPVLGVCRPDPHGHEHVHMCAEMSAARCANDAMCFNGGVCDQEAVTAQVCICQSGYEGLYCEIDLYPLRTRRSGLLAICLLMLFLVLVTLLFFLYARRQRKLQRAIVPESFKKATSPMIGHVRRRVEQVKTRYNGVTATPEVDESRGASMEGGGSFSNPMYEEKVIIVPSSDKSPLVSSAVDMYYSSAPPHYAEHVYRSSEEQKTESLAAYQYTGDGVNIR